MKNLALFIVDRLGINSSRTKNIIKHLGWSTFFKIGSVVANFLIVPLTIDYLDNENYGIWLTLSAFIGWFSFFDIGLGHGLRNKFSEAKTEGNYILAKAYVSCAYYIISIIGIVVLIAFLIANQFIDWTSVFNTSKSLEPNLLLLMPIVFSFFVMQMVLKLITTIYAADQNHSIYNKVEFFTRVFSLLLIYLLLQLGNSSLLLFGSIFSALPVVILLALNIFAFSGTYSEFKPSLKFFKKRYLKDITGLGFNFFIVQIAMLVLYSTDNFIITKIFGPTEVVPYSIAQKYFSILFMAHSLLVMPYWSAFTEAYAKKEYNWIKHSVKTVQRIWLLVPLGLIVMLFFAKMFYLFWVGESVVVPWNLSAAMALSVALMTYQSMYVQFLNGIGKIRVQLYVNIFSLILNIPLSIYFAKTLELGLAGVILATCVSLLLSVVLYPVQYKKLINGTATGVWNK